MPASNKVPKTISLDKKLHQWAKTRAELHGLNFSQYLENLILYDKTHNHDKGIPLVKR